jgi:SAM-dependent methyltransferase
MGPGRREEDDVGTIERLTPDQIHHIDDHNRAQWGRVAPTYAEGFEVLTGAAAEPTLDAGGVGRGTEMLDVGTGPGTLIGPALSRGASISAVDLTDEMVSEVRRRFPSIDARTAKASELPFDALSFDAVILGFCVHHMAEPVRALAEAHRVLRPGGRIAFTVWGELERLEAFGIAFAALAQLELGDDEPPPELPLPMGRPLVDYETALEQAGFVQPSARNLQIGWRVQGARAIIDGFERFFGLAPVLSDNQRIAFGSAVEQAVTERADPDGTTYLPNPAILAAARKPC